MTRVCRAVKIKSNVYLQAFGLVGMRWCHNLACLCAYVAPQICLQAFGLVGLKWCQYIVALGAISGILTGTMVGLLVVTRLFVATGAPQGAPSRPQATSMMGGGLSLWPCLHACLVAWAGSGACF